MRSSLTRTLFVCFLSLTAVVLLATLGLARWSFERGFLDYVNNLERVRLERIGEVLLERYVAAGESWSTMADGEFERIVVRHSPKRRPPSNGRPIPRSAGRVDGGPAPIPPRRPPLPTALFDADGRRLAGDAIASAPEDRVRVPLVHDARIVGELGSIVQRRLDAPGETAFSREQARRSVLIGALALVLAGVVSWWLSRSLLAPVRRSIASVARLSRGDYTIDASRPVIRGGGGGELGRLAEDLERLRHTLEAGRTARRRLLADVSHELRTPLTILSGEIDAMRDGIRSVGPEQLASLAQEVDRLTRLVEDLFTLSLSDVGGLRYTFAPLELDALLRRSVAAFEHASGDRDLDVVLELDGPLRVEGDTSRLEQLFANLISNAVDYTDAPGVIRIGATGSPDVVDIVVEDTPPAPATTRLEKLFDSLYRDERSRNRRSGGAGLGLAICRNIVTAHGGRITASRSTLGGLRIDVTLPVRRENSA